MKQKRFRCQHCKKICTAQVNEQNFCNHDKCQKARRNAWYREKCSKDPDYRANQRASNQKWLDSKGGSATYFREYRKRKKKVAKVKQLTQAQEHLKEGGGVGLESEIKDLSKSAKLDVAFTKTPLKTGRYIITSDHSEQGAKLDAILVEITVISMS